MVYRVLTIAGSDSSGGAGIQTDLKTYSALGIYGMSAITSITAQNTTGVTMIEDISPECVKAQIKACIDDIGVDAVKIGMLSNVGIIEAVGQTLSQYDIKHIVLDPVMVATTGAMLLQPDAKAALIKLLKKATLITPNKAEAEVLADMKITDLDSALKAAEKIATYTDAAILIKGIAPATDLYVKNGTHTLLEGEWIDTTNSHGTGCTMSSAIAAYLARGDNMDMAVKKGKAFISYAIEHALPIGHGSGPTNPLAKVWQLYDSKETEA